jgi:glycosyltransferase involved in cell wall biosynthesis
MLTGMSTVPTTRKKVLFLITKSNWGGAQRYVYDLATHLDHTTFEPVVALGGHEQLSELLTHAGIRVIHLESLARDISFKKEWALVQELWHLLRTERPEIFHVNSSKAGGVGALLGRLAGVPRVLFTAHGWAFNEDRPWWQRLLIKTLHWLTVLLAHKTIAVSNAIITQMNWPLARRKMKLIHLGRTIGPMYGKREARTHLAAVCPRLAPFTNTPWLGCVAELHPIKRHTVLIDAVQRLILDHPTLRLVLIGDGELREDLAARIVDARLESVVFLTGAIPEAARFLKAFDICVLASKSESYGYVLHEAGLADVPVVATNVGGIPDVVTHEQTGLLVPADDASALAAALARLLTDHAYANTLAHAHTKAMTERSVTTMANATAALYLLPL